MKEINYEEEMYRIANLCNVAREPIDIVNGICHELDVRFDRYMHLNGFYYRDNSILDYEDEFVFDIDENGIKELMDCWGNKFVGREEAVKIYELLERVSHEYKEYKRACLEMEEQAPDEIMEICMNCIELYGEAPKLVYKGIDPRRNGEGFIDNEGYLFMFGRNCSFQYTEIKRIYEYSRKFVDYYNEHRERLEDDIGVELKRDEHNLGFYARDKNSGKDYYNIEDLEELINNWG